ncbi:MAG: CBS domain-containing protein [Thermoplasmata archaeon]
MTLVRVRDYMVLSVEHVGESTPIGQAIERVISSRHHGFPVTDADGRLVGFVSTKELLRARHRSGEPLSAILRHGTYTASPETALDDAARVMFRYGLRDLPIVDAEGKLCGIISNLDIVRSHFERASPAKADTLKHLLAERYGLTFSYRRGLVPLDQLMPTQWKVFEDELEGRRYELERGFAEPLLVLEKGDRWLLIDGHHRALAAREMGLTQLQAFILRCDESVQFTHVETGLERTAREHHLGTLADVQIDRTAHHPLVEVTTQLLRRVDPLEAPDLPPPSE